MDNIENEKYRKLIEDIFNGLDTNKHKFKPIKKKIKETGDDIAQSCCIISHISVITVFCRFCSCFGFSSRK